MYLARKGDAVCRIPESHAAYYMELGYSLTDLDAPPAEPEKIVPQKKEEGKKPKE